MKQKMTIEELKNFLNQFNDNDVIQFDCYGGIDGGGEFGCMNITVNNKVIFEFLN